jgi:hypothetical protein
LSKNALGYLGRHEAGDVDRLDRVGDRAIQGLDARRAGQGDRGDAGREVDAENLCDDADYLRALHKQGITATGGDQTMIKLGHMICDLRSDGYSENSAISMAKLHGNSMTDQDARVIVTSAEAAYCPEYIQ